MSNWLDSSNNTNCYKSMYVNGFIDVSGGNIQTRNADNHLLIAGDCSFNSNLSLGKDLSIGIENSQYAVDISGTVDLKDNLLMRGDLSLNKTVAAQNAGTLENHNYSEQFDDYDNLILKTDQSTSEDTANDEFTTNLSSTLIQKAYLKASNIGANDEFGGVLAISGDYAIVGAKKERSNSINDPSNDDVNSAGAAYIFKTSDSGETWTLKAYLKAQYPDFIDYFGYSVAINGDYAIVGAYGESSNSITDQTINHANGQAGYQSGAAYIFKRDSGAETWSQTAFLKASTIGASDWFGRSVAIDGDIAVVGAAHEDSNSINNEANNDASAAGAAYIFKRDNGAETWTQKAYLKAQYPDTNDFFGTSAAKSGDYVIIGAEQERSGDINDQTNNDETWAGAAYIFKTSDSGETWTQQAYLKASNLYQYDKFGYSVAINGDYAIIGSKDYVANYEGAAYIFKRELDSGGVETWTQKDILKAVNADDGDYFGNSVSISGDYAIIGAWKQSSQGSGAGAAYIFKRDSGAETWTQQSYFNAENPGVSDYFGCSVAIDGDIYIVGAYGNDSNSITDDTINDYSGSGIGSGAAYIFKPTTNTELTAPTAGANNMVLSDDGNRYAYIHGWTGATTQGAGTGGTLKVRSYNNGWSEDTVNDSGSLSVSTGNGSKNLYISGDGIVIVTAQVDSENYDSATDSTNGKIYMWIRNSSTNQWDRTIINVNNTLITGTPKAKNFNNWMTGGFGGVAVNYDGTRIAFSNAGVNDDNSGDASDLFVFGRSGTTLTYLGGVQTSGWGKICRCIFTKSGDKLFVGNYADNDVKIYTIGSSSISLTKTITTSAHTTAGQLGINETGTKMVYLKDNTNFTVRTTSDNWANSTETTKTYPSSREFNHVGGASSNQNNLYGKWLDMSPNGNTMMVSTITGDNKRGRIGVYDISDLNSITEVKYLDAEAGTYNDDFKVGNNVVCKNTHYGFTANGESTGNWKSYNVFNSYDPTPTTNYYNQEFKGGNLFLNGNLTIDGTLSVGAVNATGNTITYDADTTMNKRLYVNNSDILYELSTPATSTTTSTTTTQTTTVNARDVYNTGTANFSDGDDAILENSGVKMEIFQGTAGTKYLPFRNTTAKFFPWWGSSSSTAHGFVGDVVFNTNANYSRFPCIGSHISDTTGDEGQYTSGVYGCHPDWIAFHPASGSNLDNTEKLFIKVTPSTNYTIKSYTLRYQGSSSGTVSIQTGSSYTQHSARTDLTWNGGGAGDWTAEGTVDGYSDVKKYTKTDDITENGYLYIYIDDTSGFTGDAGTIKLEFNIEEEVATTTTTTTSAILTVDSTEVASNINTSGTFFADVSLNHNLVVPGNITIVDGSANNYGAYTTFTNKDATAYFNVGKSASNVFNIVDNNNIGVYMASDGNSMTSTSDERLKTDIESLDDPTEKLMQLKPCTYKWKTQEDDKKHVGFIAQEVEEVLPELVNETTYPDGASYKGVATSDLIPYLIKSIQERQLRINKLENK